MKLQRMLENGKWIDEDRVQEFITMALEIDPDAISKLESGAQVKHNQNYWFTKIRIARPPVAKIAIVEEWVQCDCGDVVKSGQVMNASRGTSCPDCYDAMSL